MLDQQDGEYQESSENSDTEYKKLSTHLCKLYEDDVSNESLESDEVDVFYERFVCKHQDHTH